MKLLEVDICLIAVTKYLTKIKQELWYLFWLTVHGYSHHVGKSREQDHKAAAQIASAATEQEVMNSGAQSSFLFLSVLGPSAGAGPPSGRECLCTSVNPV